MSCKQQWRGFRNVNMLQFSICLMACFIILIILFLIILFLVMILNNLHNMTLQIALFESLTVHKPTHTQLLSRGGCGVLWRLTGVSLP